MNPFCNSSFWVIFSPFEDDVLQDTVEVEKNTNEEQLSPKIQTTMTHQIKEPVKSPGGKCYVTKKVNDVEGKSKGIRSFSAFFQR